jgi:hypothetical protein
MVYTQSNIEPKIPITTPRHTNPMLRVSAPPPLLGAE